MKPASQPKIIFFDIDDTLRPKESGTVPDSTREALRKLKRQGIVTAIATGRSPVILPADIRRLMDETGIEMLVAINGQYVEYRRRPLAAFPIPQADIDAAVAYLSRCNTAYALVSDNGIGIPGTSDHLHEALSSLSIPYQTGSLPPDTPVYQMLAFYGEDEAAEVESGLPPSLRTTRWHRYGMDILARNGSKARGIGAALDKLGLTMNDAMAFGDGLNDMEMLHAVGFGVAMGNAHPALKAVADHICPPVGEDGIWHALHDLGVLAD